MATMPNIMTISELEELEAQQKKFRETYDPSETPLTLEIMRRLDHRIDELVVSGERIARSWGFSWDELWYGLDRAVSIKRMVCWLAGMERQEGPACLRTSQAYDLLYEHILEIVQEHNPDQADCDSQVWDSTRR